MAGRVLDLALGDVYRDSIYSDMRLLTDEIQPTEDQRDLIARAWQDMAGEKVVANLGLTGVRVYPHLSTIEVDEGADTGMTEAELISAVRAACQTIKPSHDDLVLLATEVLGADLVAALNI